MGQVMTDLFIHRINKWCGRLLGQKRSSSPLMNRKDVIHLAKGYMGIDDSHEYLSYHPISAEIGWRGKRKVWTVTTSFTAGDARLEVLIDDLTSRAIRIAIIPCNVFEVPL